MEYEICALLNIKSKYLKDKFKNVHLLNKRAKLIEYLTEEFGPFNISKCEHLFDSIGFYKPTTIHSYVLRYSLILSTLCSYIYFDNITYNAIGVFFIIYFISIFGLLYAK